MIQKICVVTILVVISLAVFSQDSSYMHLHNNRKLVIVTIDGLRWQEVFYGADSTLLANDRFVENKEYTKQQFWDENKDQRRAKLMPFLTDVMFANGTLIGDRIAGSFMSVSNQQYFSYPGYNEIFTGRSDPELKSNAKVPNPNITFLEWLNKQPEYQHKMGIFSGWDVFPMIFNRARSELFINAGFEALILPNQNTLPNTILAQISVMNSLQAAIPSPWKNVRHDAFTYSFAKLYLQYNTPKVLVINFGETDDFAHNGKYDSYLESANKTDAYIKDLWLTLQTMPDYKNNTNLLIITDHGRGSTENDWQHHASAKAVRDYITNLDGFEEGVVGSEHIWFAAMGPDIKQQGLLVSVQEIKQSQFTATALALIGIDVSEYSNKASPLIQDLINE